MSDASRSAHRTHRGPTSQAARSPESSSAALPCVIAGLLRGHAELTLLAKAAAGLARIELVDDRFALISTIQAFRPGVLVLPPFDLDHTSTAPLVFRVRREAPSVAVLLLSSHPAGAGQPMLRAAQAGAHVITSPTSAELRAALADLLPSQGVGQ
jgi:hypothetical protein